MIPLRLRQCICRHLLFVAAISFLLGCAIIAPNLTQDQVPSRLPDQPPPAIIDVPHLSGEWTGTEKLTNANQGAVQNHCRIR